MTILPLERLVLFVDGGSCGLPGHALGLLTRSPLVLMFPLVQTNLRRETAVIELLDTPLVVRKYHVEVPEVLRYLMALLIVFKYDK